MRYLSTLIPFHWALRAKVLFLCLLWTGSLWSRVAGASTWLANFSSSSLSPAVFWVSLWIGIYRCWAIFFLTSISWMPDGNSHEILMANSISSDVPVAYDKEVGRKIDAFSTISLCRPQMKSCIRMALSKECSRPVFTSNSAACFLTDFGPCERFTIFARACLALSLLPNQSSEASRNDA